MDNSQLSFKEMCKRFDVTPRTLRYYEYIELLSPTRQGRTRYYGQSDVARMTLILRGRRWGFSLETIRQWLLMREQKGDRAQMEEWVRLATNQLAELEREIEELKTAKAELAQTRDKIAMDLSASD